MNEQRLQEALLSIARQGIPDDINLWPAIAAQVKRKILIMRLRTQPAFILLVLLVALALLTSVAYAIGRLTGFLPGAGFVETSTLRVLAEPVVVTRLGISVSIEQVVADSERTIIIYKTEGMTIEAANSKGEGGPFGSTHLLRLPDGTIFQEKSSEGYGGTPEPLIQPVQTEGGWPNYVQRLVYPPVPPDINELILIIPVLQNMPPGAAPENWEIPFRLKPAPPEFTLAPFTILPTIKPASTQQGGTPVAIPSHIATINGFTLQLDNVIELEDGFIFTGRLSWDASAFPAGKGVLAESITPTFTDSSGQQIPVEELPLDAPYREFSIDWSYRTNRKAFDGPLTVSVSSIKLNVAASPIAIEIDLGPNTAVGQVIAVNRDFSVAGHTVHLLAVRLSPAPESCQGINLEFSFSADTTGLYAQVTDALPTNPMVCTGIVSGGGGGPVDPTVFTTMLTYRDRPTGRRQFFVEFWYPVEITGPWQISWNPPLISEPVPTPQPAACLTLETWHQAKNKGGALPSGVNGQVVTTINEGGPLPAIYIHAPDGTNARKIGSGAWPSLSNNGRQLIYSAADGLQLVDLSGGQSTPLITDGYRLIWSPDDTRLMFTTTFGLYIVNSDGTGLQQVGVGSGQVLAPVGWLTDNQTIVYSSLSGDGFDLKTYNLQSGETHELFTIHNKAGYAALSPTGEWLVFADREFGAQNWGIFISRLDGSERKAIVAPEVPTAFMAVWGPDGQWLIVNTRAAEEDINIPVLVNPFTCEVYFLRQLEGMVESWSK